MKTRRESTNPRQIALIALREIYRGAFADVALSRILSRHSLNPLDRGLATELVYGTVRRQKTLDALINQLAKKKSSQQPPDLRLVLHLGLYQLRFLSHIPASAAVNTTVELAKHNGFAGLTGFVNGVLRQYVRLAQQGDPLILPDDAIARLAMLHSYPDWLVELWFHEMGLERAEALCQWFNRPPHIDLRANLLRCDRAKLEAVFAQHSIGVQPLLGLPQGLRLVEGQGAIWDLPGFAEGWWSVQDGSSQWVGQFLNPQPGETIIDACAAPGGKTTHIAELMGDRGTIWACDRAASRLKKVQENIDRLGLQSIRLCEGDSRALSQFDQQADRVLLDAPCSGLGTLHRHADARWRQTPETIQDLIGLQKELLSQVARWVKPGGILVYSTCTLNPTENEQQVNEFLESHPDWRLDPPQPHEAIAPFQASAGWIKIVPTDWDMDGFFMARMRNRALN